MAIFPGSVHSFAVVYTEKLAFQRITLQSYHEYRWCTSVATLFAVSFFLLRVHSSLKNKQTIITIVTVDALVQRHG